MTALKEVTPRIQKVYMLGDSRTILQALKSEATPFSEFFANRIGEIYDCIRDIPEDIEVIWGWVKSSDNACLLYTSPSPRDRTRSRMPSSA